ncbi:MAG: glycosyltransferase family 39 protein, partial [Myxococcota bacterium]
MVTGVFLRLLFFTGPIGGDDSRYLHFAEQFVTLQSFDWVNHAAGRLVFLILVGIPFVLGGHAVHAALANLLFSVITDLLATYVAFRRFGWIGALIVAQVMALCGTNIIYTSAVLPDTLLTLLMLLAVLAVERALGSAEERERWRWMVIAGLVTGAAYSCKDPGILLLVPVGAVVLLNQSQLCARLSLLATYAAGLGAFLIADGLIYLAYTGDFFYRYSAIGAVHNVSIGAHGVGEFLAVAWDHILKAVSSWRLTGVSILAGFVLFPLALRHHPPLRLFAATGLFVSLYLLFGSSSLSRLVPLPFQPRYFQPIIPFVSLCLAGLLVPWLQVARRYRAPVHLTLGLLVFITGMGPVQSQAGRMY